MGAGAVPCMWEGEVVLLVSAGKKSPYTKSEQWSFRAVPNVGMGARLFFDRGVMVLLVKRAQGKIANIAVRYLAPRFASQGIIDYL